MTLDLIAVSDAMIDKSVKSTRPVYL